MEIKKESSWFVPTMRSTASERGANELQDLR